jgi:cyclophilin family peptidyl-prolyl cis-trans isomerase
MGSQKRERQKENRQRRLESEFESTRRQQRKRKILTLSIVAFVIGLVIVVVAVTGDDDDASGPLATQVTDGDAPDDGDAADGTGDGGDDGDAAGSGDAAGAGDDVLTAPEPGGLAPEGECPAEDGSSPRATEFSAPPPMCIDPDLAHEAVITTDAGEFTIALDSEAAPVTVNNFVVLARYGFYDGVAFHRVIPGFVVQGGDAVGDPPGTGNPGYRLADELPDSVADYTEGSVAMANSGPDTNGSQWFVWMGPQPLPAPAYSLFGQVIDGLDVVRAIEADGSPMGDPVVVHRIESVEIVVTDP